MDNGGNNRRPLAVAMVGVLFLLPLLYGALGDKTFDGDVTCNELLLRPGGQNFLFTNRGTTLALQNQSALSLEFELYSGGGLTKDSFISLFVEGTPESASTNSRLRIGYDYDNYFYGNIWQIYSAESGDGHLMPVHMGTGTNTDQLILNTDGTVSVTNGISGDLEIDGDLYLTTAGKGINLDAGGSQTIWIYPYIWEGGPKNTIRIPALAYGSGSFLTVDENGGLIFMATASYEGDVQSVWTGESGDVGDLAAAAGDTLDAASADATIPWKVSTPAAPTIQGQAVWDSNENFLAVGDGTETVHVGPPTHPPVSPASSGRTGQVAYDSKYVYCYVQTNVWKRAALSTWTDEKLILETGWKILLEDSEFILLE